MAASFGHALASPGSGSGGDDDDFDVSDYSSGSDRDDDDRDDDDRDDDGRGDDDRGDDDRSGNTGSGGGDDDRSDNSGSGSGSSGSGGSRLDDHRDSTRRVDGESTQAASDHHHVYSIEIDDFGQEYVSRELLLAGSPQDVRTARDAGFEVMAEQRLTAINQRLVRLRTPAGMSAHEAMARLRPQTPGATISVNSIYRNAQSFVSTAQPRAPSRPHRLTTTMGIIDTGVHAQQVQPSAIASQTAFAGPRPVGREHGSMVAAIAAEQGARVHVADVFGQSADGALAASAENIAAALNWMIEHNVAVINISIQGPDNPVIAQLVRRAAERGHVVVAAAGNGGPTARPSFPAAFDGVLAVTAIDVEGRPYLRANRGDYIDFAAPGVDVDVESGGDRLTVSGTSFAAPLVAARIAASLSTPSAREASRILAALQAGAEDLGAPGRDPIFGWGALRD